MWETRGGAGAGHSQCGWQGIQSTCLRAGGTSGVVVGCLREVDERSAICLIRNEGGGISLRPSAVEVPGLLRDTEACGPLCLTWRGGAKVPLEARELSHRVLGVRDAGLGCFCGLS